MNQHMLSNTIKLSRFLCALSLFSMLVSGAVHAGSSEDEYKEKLQSLQRNINQLKNELEDVKSSRNQLERELQTSEVNIGKLTSSINRLKEELASGKKQLLQLNRHRTELQIQRREQQKAIAEYINSAYRLGQQSQIKLLLNQQNPDELARTLKYHEYFIEARTDKIDAFLSTIAELDTIEPKIAAETQSIKDKQGSLQKRHSQLLVKQKDRQLVLKNLSATIKSKDDQLKQKTRDRERLERLLEEVTQAIANLTIPGGGQPFEKRRGKMAWPVKGPLLNSFGSAKKVGELRWEGIRIKASLGNDVQSIHHGRVVFSDYLRGHGLLMIVDHGKGYMSLYAHNQALLKDLGDWVNAGEIIAKVGNTGGQSQTGLYFEIRHQGKPTDPTKWCARR